MPINRLLRGSELSPREIEILNDVFNLALRDLHLVDRNDPICEIVGRKVIELYAGGVSDPREIASLTVKELGP